MLEDRCPHRFAELSRGERQGDALACPYHGLTFDAGGHCIHNPFAAEPPAGARVRSLPAVARHGMVWVWPGGPELADDAAIPDFAFLESQDVKRGHSLFAAGYELLTDNLMDLGHVEFIHKPTFHPNGAAFRGRYEVKAGEDGAIWSNWRLPGVNRPPFLDGLTAPGAPVDQHLHMRWNAPASMMLDIAWTAGGDAHDRPLVRDVAPHIVTPETATTSHYFWTCAPTAEGEALARAVFDDEDRPMVEAIQRAMGDAEFWSLKPLILQGDPAAIQARRRLAQLRREEETLSVAA